MNIFELAVVGAGTLGSLIATMVGLYGVGPRWLLAGSSVSLGMNAQAFIGLASDALS